MAGNLGNFDANNEDPIGSFETIPAGWYRGVIVQSEMRPTRTGGEYLQLVHEIMEGEHKGRRVWARLNLNNANPKTVEIARRELATVCRATGVMTPRDSSEFHDIPMFFRVRVQKRNDAPGEFSNSVVNWKHRDDPPKDQHGIGEPSRSGASAPPAAGGDPWGS